jgi:two-component system chemotaxis response regulator CheV
VEKKMATMLNRVNEQTNIAGENRMQLLLFTLPNLEQRFGINVFKVREVLKCPKLTRVMGSNKAVKGMANIRGETVPVIDLAGSIGFEDKVDISNSMLILTEYNNSVQGFAVESVQNIQNVSWEQVEDPPETLGADHHLTAVANIDNELVNIIDVEDVLSKISPKFAKYAEDDYDTGLKNIKKEGFHRRILILDDSIVARKQLIKAVNALGFEVDDFKNGKVALDHVNDVLKTKNSLNDVYDLIISDIEMPQMDGYTFVSKVRELKQDVKIILHTSLSGVFNEQLVKKVGADSFISKFEPKILGAEIKKMLGIEED